MEDNITTTETTTTETGEATPKTYSQEEFEAALQSETDRRVTAALKKAERKKEAEIAEATKLAKMNDEQRYQHELEKREQALVEKEKALALAENKAEASKVLSSRGISADLVELVVSDDADTMLQNINLLEKAFKNSVKAEVEKRLASKTPQKNLPLDNNLTREGFHKMSLTQQAELFRNNPDVYKKLSGMD
jgi:hypothetical protein